jgi:hypothetical protein
VLFSNEKQSMKEEENGVVQAKDGVGASTRMPRMILASSSRRRS